MKLTLEGIKSREEWTSKGYILPDYDIDAVHAKTIANPEWIHFGAGNIFRIFIAGLSQSLLSSGEADRGIIAVDTFDFDMLEKIYKPFDSLSLSVGLKADGSVVKEIVASIADYVKGDMNDDSCKKRLVQIAKNPGLRMMSFTITEKGYALRNMAGELLGVVKEDMANGPANPKHAMSIVTALLYERFKAGALPIAVCSMDNCSHNGEKLKASVTEIAKAWLENNYVNQKFVEYIEDESLVSFPWSMIDKITPRPAKDIEEMLKGDGVEDMAPVVTDKNTFIAPFVNAEMPQYLVIEDRFPNGRPALEKAGVYFTDRETVNKTERMKVTTCLNPLHTAMAVYGCLLGYTHIATEFKDEDIHSLVYEIGYNEGLPVVTDPGIIHPKDFLDEVMNERLPNMHIPDMPQRIATDTSMKVPIRFGETIKAYIADPSRDATSLTYIPLAIAGWFRYLLGIDDNGDAFEISSDPQLEDLQKAFAGVEFGKPESYTGQAKAVLSNESIFGSDLTKAGLLPKIEEMYVKMLEGPGAVRRTLHEYVSERG